LNMRPVVERSGGALTVAALIGDGPERANLTVEEYVADNPGG